MNLGMVLKTENTNRSSISARFAYIYNIKIIFFTLIFVISCFNFILAASTVSNVTVSPGTVAAGGTITVDFDFVAGNSNMSWSVAFRPNADGTTLNQNWGGTTDQDIMVYGGTIDNICADCGGQIGKTTGSVTTGSTQQISSYETVALTVPSGYADGTYSLIVVVRDGTNIYINALDDEDYTTFTVGAAATVDAEKSVSATTASIGDTLTYCITATNNIGSSATFDIWDTVPGTMTYVGCDNSCTQSSGLVSWTVTGLADTSAVTRCFWVTVSSLPYFEQKKIFMAYVRQSSFAMLNRSYHALKLSSLNNVGVN